MPHPTNQAIAATRPALMPMIRAAPGSSAVARIAMPNGDFLKNQATPAIASSAMAAATILFQASTMPSTVTVPGTSVGNGRGRVPQPRKMPA